MDVSILGSMESARAALYYLLKYLTKDATQVESVLTLLAAARRHVQRFPSQAADSGTPRREALHTIMRIANQQNLQMEYSGTQAALRMVGLPTAVSTTGFSYVFVTAAAAHINSKNRFTHGIYRWASEAQTGGGGQVTVGGARDGRGGNDSDSDSDSGDGEEEEEEEGEEAARQRNAGSRREGDAAAAAALGRGRLHVGEEDDEEMAAGGDFAPLTRMERRVYRQLGAATVTTGATFYRLPDGRLLPLPQHVHYGERGDDLRMMALYDWVGTIKVKRCPQAETERPDAQARAERPNRPRRQPNGSFHFASSHPLFGIYYQVLRSKQVTPQLCAGRPPLDPGPPPSPMTPQWPPRAQKWAEYWMALLVPWWWPCDSMRSAGPAPRGSHDRQGHPAPRGSTTGCPACGSNGSP